jgi:phospholipid-binding lipoprotein MlaA
MDGTNFLRMMHRCTSATLTIAILAALGGCATGPTSTPSDPLERINRVTFRVNDAIDRTVAQPAARGYNKVVPGPARTAVYNFFSNIGDVVVMANDFAQGHVGDGLSDFMRIAVNSTFGIGGLIDIATPAGLEKHNQDFGLTLGHWGLPSGPYLVLPLFGPSTFRDAAGFAGDVAITPTTYLEPAKRNSLFAVQFVSTRARYLDATNLLEQAALDKYAFTRDAYLGRRRYLLNSGREESLPNYESEAAPGEKSADGEGGSTAPRAPGNAPAGTPVPRPNSGMGPRER